MTKSEISEILDKQSEVLADLGYHAQSSKLDAISLKVSLYEDTNKEQSLANMVLATIVGLFNEYSDVMRDKELKSLDILIEKLTEMKNNGKIPTLREILSAIHKI